MTNLFKEILIKRDKKIFTQIVHEEKNLFDDLDNSLNSFKEDHKLYEIINLSNCAEKQIIKSLNNQLIKEQSNNVQLDDQLKKENSKNENVQLNNEINLNQEKIDQSTSLDQISLDQSIESSINQSDNLDQSANLDQSTNLDQSIKEQNYILILEYNNNRLENLLDEINYINDIRSKTGKINYASDQIRCIKRKLIFLIQNQQDQFIINNNEKIFLNNDECFQFMNYVLERNLEFKIDHNLNLNSKLNNYLKLNFKNELIIIKILKKLNLEYDYRLNVENYIHNFRLKLEPEINLINLNRNFKSILKSMKRNMIINDNLFEQNLKIKEQKDILRLRYLNDNKLLVDKLKIDLKLIQNGNKNLLIKINILERNIKKFKNKLKDH